MAEDIPENPVDHILAEVRDLRAAFESKIRYDEGRDRTIEAMGEELDKHRQGLFQTQLRTVLLDLVAMFDDVSQMIGAPDCPPETAERLVFVRDMVTQTLARNGADLFVSDEEVVDRSLHKVVSVLKSPDPDDDRRIATRLRPGFRWNDRMLRPEWVNTYRYECGVPPAQPPADPEVALAESRSGGTAGVERDEL